MSRQVTVYPVRVELGRIGDTIRITIKRNRDLGSEVVWLRPRTKSVTAVLRDLQARAKRGDKARLGDISGWGEREPWAFQYKEKVGGKRAAPDPDHAVLRHYEQTHGCD